MRVDHIQRHFSTTTKTLSKIVLADEWGGGGTSGTGEVGSKAAMRTDARRHFVDISLLETAPGEADGGPLGDEVVETAARAWHQNFARWLTHLVALWLDILFVHFEVSFNFRLSK